MSDYSAIARPKAGSGASTRAGGQLSATAAIPRIECRRDLPLSFAQERLWFLAQIEGGSKAYQNLHGLQLRGELDRAALRRALNQIVARHEALRTVFTLVDGKPLQQIVGKRDSQFHLIEHDLRECDGAAAEFERLIAEEASTSMDLHAGPLIRGRLIRQGNEEYVLLITIHHIVSDAWSFGVFSNELSALYRAYVRGEEDGLPELEIQYVDYAVWQRKWMGGEVLGKQAEYWERALAGAPEVLQLPADHVRPEQQSYSGAAAKLVLDEELTAGLRRLSRKHRTTLYMTVLAGWAALLARLSGQDDVVIGTPAANRNRVEIEGLIGFFVNTLALRLGVSDSFDVGELVAHVRSQAVAAQKHQGIPFEQVVEIVRPPRSLAHNPVFQVMFAWQNAPKGTIDLPGLQVRPFTAVPHDISKFDLTLSLQEEGNQIVGEVEYATALYERSTIERYLGYFRTLLGAMAADDSQKVDRLPMLPAKERQQLLYEWNATEVEYPRDKCVHELFEEQVEKTPEAVAVVFENEFLSYGGLNRRANQLAHYLRELGVRPDDRVAICAERSLEMVVGLLAVLKAGGAYVPLDSAYPVERLGFMLEDSASSVLLVQGSPQGWLAEIAKTLPVVDLSPAARVWSREAESNPEAGALGLTPQHLAYVIYTSGSTGVPKGVMVEHRAINRLVLNNRYAKFEAGDGVAFASNPAFDATTMEVWAPLLNGGRSVVIEQAVLLDPVRFGQALKRHAVNILWLTVGLFNQYADALQEELSNLQYLIVGGDALNPRVISRVLCGNRPRHLINGYGPTETTTFASYFPIETVRERGTVPIGRPIANARIYILDAHGEPVPVGVTGELYIGGDGVARGYLNRPELTAEKFLKDPFTDDANGRMYRTGDLGRWLADGNIEFLGRNDFQVKIRGYRIELGEIEARLSEQEGVREAAVLVREDTPGDKRLVAYYTTSLNEGSEANAPGAEQLRAYLSASLPEYMVPAAYVRLESLPLTPNGKLDRKALPAPEGDAYGVRQYEAPQGANEELLAGIWAELLKLDQVGRHDNFFELGGHSLLAVTLSERMRRNGFAVDVQAVFATTTLAELATTIGGDASRVEAPPNLIPVGCQAITPEMLTLVELSQKEINEIVKGVPGGAANIQDIYPLAPLQEGILFHHLMGGEGDPYVVAMQFAFDSRARLDRYITALRAVINRHDILRTAVVWEGLRERVQVVWRRAELAVEEIELDATGGDAREQLYALCHPRRMRIDVRQASMLRLFIGYDSTQDRWLMVQLLHHLAGDHTTLEVMYEEVQAHLRKEEASLPEPLPFRNLVAQARLGVSREEHEIFFRQMLGDVEEPTAPFGLLDVQGDGSEIEDAHLAVEENVAKRLRKQGRRRGVSVASLCHLAWARVLAKVSEREDVVFGTVLFGRMQGGQGSDRVMGLFINTLPVRIRVDEEGVEASVRRVHSLLSDLLGHEHASLALVQRCSQVKPPTPLFSALLNYRHTPTAAHSKENLQAWEGIEALQTEERTNYPLALSVSDFGEGFSLAAQAPASVGPLRICRYMHTTLASLAEALESSPAKAVRALEILPLSEREQLLYEWNDTKAPFPSEQCVHALFEEQVEKSADAVALVFENEFLSYEELNRRANQLAHYLRDLGVRPDDRVAICAERSLEMVVGLLGVLKAGGAYVPLDPAYPAERLRFMLEDSAPVVLLTQTRLENSFIKSDAGRPIVVLDGEGAGWMTLYDDRNPRFDETRFDEIGVTAQNLACIIYTSGSTGTSKGVAVQHSGIVNLVHDWITRFGDRVRREAMQASLWTSFGFDVSIFELFAGFCFNATVNIVPEQIRADSRALFAWFVAHNIAFGYLPPFFIRDAQHADASIPPLPLELVLVGVEPSTESALYQLQRNTPGLQVVNGYGPAETTVFSTTYAEIGNRLRNTPIGRPIANTRTYILDAQGEPVPVGVTGELYIGGAGVARGYLNHPELTAEKFLKDPFTDDPNARMYRTGDIGQQLADGNIEFLGRNDFQVKMRGFRIELGEIEARLSEHEEVREAVVLAREDTPGDKRLVAYYTAREQNSVEAQALRAHLAAKLPEYMVPAAYVRLESLPLTPNGKLDRKALPTPEGDAYGVRQYEAPQGAIEELLAGIWAELLNRERVGRHDNFFELGGHSLMAVTMVERLARAGLKADVRALFATPTLAELAASFDTNAPALETPSNRIPSPQKTTSSSRIVELSI
jgi:amino acid adenylation domain-containing protein